jgi:hypothetical protein
LAVSTLVLNAVHILFVALAIAAQKLVDFANQAYFFDCLFAAPASSCQSVAAELATFLREVDAVDDFTSSVGELESQRSIAALANSFLSLQAANDGAFS